MKRPTLVAASLLFFSGLSALIYQTAWQHMLRLVLGASTAASSAVLAIFLGGLGLGGVWLGRRAEASERPLELYGSLEAGVAVTAALTPLWLDLAARIYFASGGRDALGAAGATLLRLLLVALVLGPSVVLMGGTLPAAARAVESDEDVGRERVALLYAANTAGAVAGALLGTFLLFELFGARLALWTAALVNLLVGVLARSTGRVWPKVPVSPSQEPGAGEPGADPRLVYAAASVVGFAFLGLEIVWYRLLGPILGGTSFTFGLILAVALAGIGLGGFAYSRRRRDRAPTLGTLATTLGLEALFVVLPLALGDDVAILAGTLRPLSALGFGATVLAWSAVTALTVLPAAIVSGYQFPLLLSLLGRGRRDVARQTGLAYGFNTAGSIAGALLVGFVLLPRFGLVAVWRAMIVALGLLGLAVLAVEVGPALRSWRGRGSTALLALAFAFALLPARGPGALSRHTPIGAGRVSFADSDKNKLRELLTEASANLLWEKDGVESSVGVDGANGIAFMVNGKSDGAVVLDRGTQALLGTLPALLHPGAKRAFVLGLGTGMSAGWLASVPGIERVDVAELEPAVVNVARDASAANQDVLARPTVHVFIGDGREFMLTHDTTYDLVVSEPSNPYRAGIASLFTSEFYRTVAKRMAPGGLFGQWLQGYEIDADTLRTVFATLESVFPFVEAWQTQSGDFLLIASFEPKPIDMAMLRRRVAEEPFATLLPRAALIQDAEGVLARYVARPELVKRIASASGTAVNTDDSMLLDYAFARRVGSENRKTLPLELMLLARARGLARPDVVGPVDWNRVEEERGRAWLVAAKDPLPPPPEPEMRSRITVVDAACAGDLRLAAKAYAEHPFAPRDVIELFSVGKTLALVKDPRAFELADALGRGGYRAEAALVRARADTALGRSADATGALLDGVAALRQTALPLCQTARETLDLLTLSTREDPAAAAQAARVLGQGPLAVYIEDERRISVAQTLAFRSGDPELCVAALGRQLDQPWWNERFLGSRADCLARAGHPAAARAKRDLVEFLEATSGRIEAGLTLPPPPGSAPEEPPSAEADAAAP